MTSYISGSATEASLRLALAKLYRLFLVASLVRGVLAVEVPEVAVEPSVPNSSDAILLGGRLSWRAAQDGITRRMVKFHHSRLGGAPKLEATFIHGARHGPWLEHSASGEIQKQTWYVLGKEVEKERGRPLTKRTLSPLTKPVTAQLGPDLLLLVRTANEAWLGDSYADFAVNRLGKARSGESDATTNAITYVMRAGYWLYVQGNPRAAHRDLLTAKQLCRGLTKTLDDGQNSLVIVDRRLTQEIVNLLHYSALSSLDRAVADDLLTPSMADFLRPRYENMPRELRRLEEHKRTERRSYWEGVGVFPMFDSVDALLSACVDTKYSVLACILAQGE